jgi:hypothetical protein
VEDVQSLVFIEMGRPLYSFSFSLFSHANGHRTLLGSHKIVRPFDEFASLHAQVEALAQEVSLPPFPATEWLSFSIRLEVLKQRQAILKQYFAELLSCDVFLRSQAAHALYNIPQRISTALLGLGNQN